MRTHAGVAGDLFGTSVAGVGDVNGDGTPDYIIGLPGWGPFAAGRATVHSGVDGSVLYNFNGSAVADFMGYSVAGAGDVNDDGAPDFIVAAPYSFLGEDVAGAAFVFSGADGSELWEFAGDQEAEHLGLGVGAAGDVDGDGYDDLVTGSPDYDGTLGDATGRVMVFSGFDGGVLLQWESVPGGNMGESVCGLGDVNGDGYADIAAAAPGVATVLVIDVHNAAVLHTLSDGQINSNFGHSIADAGDIDGDGVDDLVVGATGHVVGGEPRGRVFIYSGADGDLIDSVTGPEAAVLFGGSVSGAGDANGDGTPDIVIGIPKDNRGGDDAGRVEIRDGVTLDVVAAFNAAAPYTSFASAVAGVGDLDGDGLSDVIVGCPREDADDRGMVYIYTGAPIVIGPDEPDEYSLGGHKPEFVLTADVNGDGALDVITVNPADDSLSIFRNHLDGTLENPSHISAYDNPVAAAAADFDDDGDVDLAVACSKQNRILMFRNTGFGSFSKTGQIDTGKKPRSIVTADFNGDGRPDLAVADQTGDDVWVFRNTSSSAPLHQRFASPKKYDVKQGPIQIAAGDQNGDGDIDLFVLCADDNRICVLRNKGNGTFMAQKATPVSDQTVALAVGDYDHDGLDDVACVSKASNQASVRPSNGNGTFGAAVKYTVGDSPRSVLLTDLDDDGWVDLLVSDFADELVTRLMNDGSGLFEAGVDTVVSDDPVWMAVGDIDLDGAPDVVSAGKGSNAISVLMNDWD